MVPDAPAQGFAVAGRCVALNNCVSSPNYPNDYGGSEMCTIMAPPDVSVRATFFDVDEDDELIINAITYSGVAEPSLGVALLVAQLPITWQASSSCAAANRTGGCQTCPLVLR